MTNFSGHLRKNVVCCQVNKFEISWCMIKYLCLVKSYDNRLSSDGQDFFTSYDEVYDSFDAMGLQENLLRGIYAYGMLE